MIEELPSSFASNAKLIHKKKPVIIPKGWGREVIFANTQEYCGKLLVFEQEGHEGSMHFHLSKHETFYVLSGKFKLKIINPINADESVLELEAGDSVVIPRGQPHRIVCVEAGTILEASTPDSPTDSYRVAKGDSQRI